MGVGCPCSSWTNKLITAKDHASVQINIGHLDGNGQFNGTYTTLALAGNVRAWVSAQEVATRPDCVLDYFKAQFRFELTSEPAQAPVVAKLTVSLWLCGRMRACGERGSLGRSGEA